MTYWEPQSETLSRSELTRLQFDRLGKTLERAAKSPYYAEVFKRHNIEPGSIRGLDDLRRIPFTTKEDLRNHFPYGLLTTPIKEIVRLHCSSGTTGNPIVVFYNQHDLAAWANLVARSMFAAGVRDTDVFQNICGYGLFTGGLGFQYGAERLGALTIPAGAGNSKRQIKLMQDFGTTVIHTIPSYLMRFRAVFDEMCLDPCKHTKLRIILTGAEPHSEETRQRVQKLFGVKAFNSYGLSEMNGPGVAFECEHQTGMHVWEDSYILEVVDPDTLEPVEPGKTGELVFTTLTREAQPILRYRTRDLTRVIPGDCPCGRTHARIDRIQGRSDDMFIIKGVNVFPIQIERILMSMPEVGNDYLIVLDTVKGADEVSVQVEVRPETFTGSMDALEKLRQRIVRDLHDEILVTPKVELVEPDSLPKSEGKAVRVKDLRNKGCLSQQ